MRGRRRTIHEFNEVQEYFKHLDVSSKLKTRKTETLHNRCSLSNRYAEHAISVPNIKVLAKKIKLIIEDGAQIKFSNFDEKVKEKNDFASTPKLEQKDQSQYKNDNTQTVVKEIAPQRVRALKHQKNGAECQWLKFLEDQDQSVNDQLAFELSQVNQNQNIDFLIKQDSQNFYSQKQTFWENQIDFSDFWSTQSQSQKSSVAVVEVKDVPQNILQALQTSVQTLNQDK